MERGMSRTAAIILALGFVVLLHFTDRIIAGFVQCDAAQTCPYSTEMGGER